MLEDEHRVRVFDRGEQHVVRVLHRGRREDLDAGHVGQNIYLQATALGLATVAVSTFQDREVLAAANLPATLKPIYLMPVGKPA